MKRLVLPGSPPLTFRAAPPRNKEQCFPLIFPFESHRGQSLKCSATFLATMLLNLPEALGGSGQGSGEETLLAVKLAVSAGWLTGCFIPPGCCSWNPPQLCREGKLMHAARGGRSHTASQSQWLRPTHAGVPEPSLAAPHLQ